MTSFIIGKVIEPMEREITVKGQKRNVYSLGILSGRKCTEFEVFDDSKLYLRLGDFVEGDTVIAVVNTALGNNGKIRHYLNAIGESPDGLSDQLRSLVARTQ